MQQADPKAYLNAAFSEVPRILSLLDRNPFSKTYGSFHRSYWFHRTADFPTSINQMGAHILALVWRHPFPNNPYHQNPKVLEWCLASVRCWMKLQHKDGSFDEWYPNERGWAGPTGYLVHAMAEVYFILGNDFPQDLREEFIQTIERAGIFLTEYNEKFVLANHHAIALLPIYEAYVITGNKKLLEGFEAKWREFEEQCFEEGWSLEYDGPDIGYLSGTVSFLSRLYRHWPDERLKAIVEKAVKFTSYFLYPDGYFGGSVGSRQTAHFYHFGYEFWAGKIPLAAKMAEEGLSSLDRGGLVPPGAQEDHYVLYRIAEYLEAYLAYKTREGDLPLLPWEGSDFVQHFPQARMYIQKQGNFYVVISLGRGGVIKVFDCAARRSVLNDCGLLIRLENAKVVTSQWNDPEYNVSINGDTLTVQGDTHEVVFKTFTPLTMILFRAFMLMFGWNRVSAYAIKAMIRRLLMVRHKRSPVGFQRTIRLTQKNVSVEDIVSVRGAGRVGQVHIGDEIPVRYVPQSRYFQFFELKTSGRYISPSDIERLNREGKLVLSRTITLTH